MMLGFYLQTACDIGKSSRIGEVIRYIHSHYQEDISLEMLAQMFYVSPYYLCREFKKSTNSTIVRYINVTRIMNAQRKFMETSKNITDISRETGFSNLTHFNRVFKSVTGMSPSQYRRQGNVFIWWKISFIKWRQGNS